MFELLKLVYKSFNTCYNLFLLILCFVDRASLYKLVNETNLVHSLFLVYLY